MLRFKEQIVPLRMSASAQLSFHLGKFSLWNSVCSGATAILGDEYVL